MELKDFIANFAAQFEETETSLIKPETKFRELAEWNSFMALSIIAMADEKYGVRLKGDDIRNAQTIEELFNIIKAKA